ncbi:hypothetical protein J4E83_010577 [Alternaria metachromatica]|uniref:uncharacterized protein n=1 Tax=Alternaria metachromatica TaxID=283354 RepID=UPI0020C2B155|nr:uncharacterized protein J4E83_010577 [Alternaria metachromatica]KAI4605584.1 hypothetical protein J4E83_010577 [Alternaria metachromatica]
MSLQKLSTELDGQIASCLVGDTKALSAFSKTNKYYRGIAEPYLYTNIEVYESELERPLRLLFTLLDRKELALHIKSLSYIPAQHWSSHDADIKPPTRKKLQYDVWNYTHAIQEVLDEVLSPGCGFSEFLSAKLTLYCDILTAPMNHYTASNQIFTLILFMAQKIQYLELGSKEPPTHVLRLLWAPWSDGKGPFQNVQHLVHNAGLSLMPSIVVLPTLRTLEYNVGYFDVEARPTTSMFAYPSPMPAQPVLRRIRFTTTRNITPAIIENMVSNPAMANLRELVVDNCGRSRHNLPLALRGDNLAELLRSLEKHTPLLELLQWSNQKSDRQEGHPRFDTFKDLTNLRQLHIDFDLLVPKSDTNSTNLKCLSNPHAVFPASLEDLTLDCIDIDKLHHLVTLLHNTIEESDEMSETEALQICLAALAAMFPPLKRLALVVIMEMDNPREDAPRLYELDPTDVTFFRYAADELEKLGVTLEVWRKEGYYEKEKKLLVKKGWTAPLPHSVVKAVQEKARGWRNGYADLRIYGA